MSKSVGTIKYPTVRVESVNCSRGMVTLEIEGGGKKVRVEMAVGCVCRLTDIAREVVGAKELLAWFVANHELPFTGILIEWKQPITRVEALAA